MEAESDSAQFYRARSEKLDEWVETSEKETREMFPMVYDPSRARKWIRSKKGCDSMAGGSFWEGPEFKVILSYIDSKSDDTRLKTRNKQNKEDLPLNRKRGWEGFYL